MTGAAPLRVLIADDEPLARHRIEDMLRREPDVAVVGTAEDGVAAADSIRALAPDLVFLDIQMPGMTGLDVVAAVGADKMPATIFVTAYDQHAIRAFELAAIDYLVKPFDDDRFTLAFARAKERLRLQAVGRVAEELVALMGRQADLSAAAPAARAEYLTRVEVESRGGTRFVSVATVDYISADGPYAELHVGGQAHLIRERMQELERRLDPAAFVRIHRSTIVRLDCVDSLRARAGGELAVRLKDGTLLAVSRRSRDEVEQRLRERA